MTDVRTRAPFGPELKAVLTELAEQMPSTLTPEMIPMLRQGSTSPPIEEILNGRAVTRREVTISGCQDAEIAVSVFAGADHSVAGPGIFHTHGGGMITGDRFLAIETMLDRVERSDAVCVSVEYRLAPEFPDPYPVEDCYAALVWTAVNAGELDIDPAHILVAGSSAGGGLAAAMALLARDRRGPGLVGQVLVYPMLDDRNDTVSSRQIDGVGMRDRGSTFTGWNALLGERRGSANVSIYAAPARATDLSGLPPAFIEVGSAEVFRDEDVAYASRIWADGGEAELHVWPGGYYGFDIMAPHAVVSHAGRPSLMPVPVLPRASKSTAEKRCPSLAPSRSRAAEDEDHSWHDNHDEANG